MRRNRRRRPLAVAPLLVLFGGGTLAAELPGNWNLVVGQDPQSYATVVSLTQDSANSIPDEYAREQLHPQLAFRCVPGPSAAISVRVDWRRFISSFNTEVGFKVDEKELLLVNWGVDRSNKITLPRSGTDSRELIDYLQAGSQLQIEVIPYSGSLVTVRYDISGIDEALVALMSKCTE